MHHYDTREQAEQNLARAKKDMAFSERDKFSIVEWSAHNFTDAVKRYSIQMHSAIGNHFCGYY